MANRAERRRAARESANRYQPPDGLDYNEFVGELRPSSDRAFTELHVRYGVRNALYVDWSITLRARLGGVEEFKESKEQLERRTLEVVDVSDSAIRRHVFDPYSPGSAPQTTVLTVLKPGDDHKVDAAYDEQMRGLSIGWAQKHGGLGAPADPHTSTTFAFASKNRDPEFRNGTYSWVRNTLISLSTDPSEAVVVERSGWYFPESPSTAGVLMPDGVMKFIHITPGGKVDKAADPPSDDGPMKATGDVTMGMLVDSIYAGDWTDGISGFLGK